MLIPRIIKKISFLILILSLQNIETRIPDLSPAENSVSPAKPKVSMLEEIHNECKNSILKIVTCHQKFNFKEPYIAPAKTLSCGSAFFIKKDGTALTNHHVTQDAIEVRCKISGFGEDLIPFDLICEYPQLDLAVIKLNAEYLENVKSKLGGEIPILELADSDTVNIGSKVVSMGYPLAVDLIKSTSGKINGWENDTSSEYFQTDSTINPGSSGGPSLNNCGKVIGINSWKKESTNGRAIQNTSFISQSNHIISMLENFGILNVPLVNIPTELGICGTHTINSFSLINPFYSNAGIYVTKVLKNFLGEKLGLQKGDLILKIGDYELDSFGMAKTPWRNEKVRSITLVQDQIRKNNICLQVLRNGEIKKLELKENFANKYLSPTRFIYLSTETFDYEVFAGLVVAPLHYNHAYEFNNYKLFDACEQKKERLVISYVQPRSLASLSQGLVAEQDLIKKVNDKKVNTLEELRKEVSESISNNLKVITIETARKTIFPIDVKKMIAEEKKLAQLYRYSVKNSLVLKENLKS